MYVVLWSQTGLYRPNSDHTPAIMYEMKDTLAEAREFKAMLLKREGASKILILKEV